MAGKRKMGSISKAHRAIHPLNPPPAGNRKGIAPHQRGGIFFARGWQAIDEPILKHYATSHTK
ncbi:MAG: hypothetical protein HY026_01345 [Deltaproteobacteria bacterium]|nr:hypothetical protein [Deltaproteobacteria bacterium]